MNVYIAPCRLFAVYLEVNRELGVFPLFSFDTCKGEIIINAPYMEIIVTPGRLLKEATGSENETGTGGPAPPSQRVAENRP